MVSTFLLYGLFCLFFECLLLLYRPGRELTSLVALCTSKCLIIFKFELHLYYCVHFQTNAHWERDEFPYLPSDGFNSTSTVLHQMRPNIFLKINSLFRYHWEIVEQLPYLGGLTLEPCAQFQMQQFIINIYHMLEGLFLEIYFFWINAKMMDNEKILRWKVILFISLSELVDVGIHVWVHVVNLKETIRNHLCLSKSFNNSLTVL